MKNVKIKHEKTRNPTKDLVEGGSSVRRRMTQQSESRKETQRPNSLLTPRNTTVIGTWNVRTMNQTGRSAIIAAEMRRYKVTVLGLSKTRWTQAGRIRISTGETVLYSGHTGIQYTKSKTPCTPKELPS